MRELRSIALLTSVLVLVAGCSRAQDTAAPVDDTAAPWWLLILVGVSLVIVLGMLVWRGRPRTPVADHTTWKDDARVAYAQTRWLYDAMGEDLAVWRGNTVAESGQAAEGAPDASDKAATWKALEQRSIVASDALYSLEARAPDNRARTAAQNAAVALRAARSDLDSRIDSRAAYRAAERDGTGAEGLRALRDREVRSSMALAESRRALDTALAGLAQLV